jgi:hypothetical protein
MPTHENIRRVVASLPPDQYRRLSAWATQEERSPDQQVSYLVKRALSRATINPAAARQAQGE